MRLKRKHLHASYSRRIGYAEREGEAIIRRQKAKQQRKELITIGVISGAVITFVAWAFWMYVTGQTPIW